MKLSFNEFSPLVLMNRKGTICNYQVYVWWVTSFGSSVFLITLHTLIFPSNGFFSCLCFHLIVTLFSHLTLEKTNAGTRWALRSLCSRVNFNLQSKCCWSLWLLTQNKWFWLWSRNKFYLFCRLLFIQSVCELNFAQVPWSQRSRSNTLQCRRSSSTAGCRLKRRSWGKRSCR